MLRFTSPLCSPLRWRRGDGGEVGPRDAALEAFLDTLAELGLDTYRISTGLDGPEDIITCLEEALIVWARAWTS